MGCARCHDHKYDPISQKEFYRLFAYFNRIPNEKGFAWNYGNEDPLVKAPLPEHTQKLAELDRQVAAAQARFDAARHGTDWAFPDGLVFQSGREATKVAGCDAAAKDCSWPTGQPAQRFDGKHYLEADGKIADFDYLQPFTMAAWIEPESPNCAIVSHVEDYFEGMGHALYLVDGKIRLHIHRRFTDLGIRVESVAPVALRQRQHVMVTYDGGRSASGVHIYLNGQPVAMKILFDQNLEPIRHPKTPLRIGAGGGLRFTGTIEDVRIYDRSLEAPEAAIIASGKEPEAPAEIRRAHDELRGAAARAQGVRGEDSQRDGDGR